MDWQIGNRLLAWSVIGLLVLFIIAANAGPGPAIISTTPAEFGAFVLLAAILVVLAGIADRIRRDD